MIVSVEETRQNLHFKISGGQITANWMENGHLTKKRITDPAPGQAGPSFRGPDGSVVWTKDGYLHREDGPALIEGNGRFAWYLEGKLHREDGPAHVIPGKFEQWSIQGENHRKDGPAIIDKSTGDQSWYWHGKHLEPETPRWNYRFGDMDPTKEWDLV